jgi:exosortase F-associated protein
MNNPLKIALLFGLAGILIVIRMFENSLFYTPLLDFFKTEHTTQPLPELDTFRLLANVALRFVINSVISVAILWLLFQKKEIVRLSVMLYIILFLLLFPLFSYLLHFSEAGEHMVLFYVRRFLIQPLLLLLLIPAFYFQKR